MAGLRVVFGGAVVLAGFVVFGFLVVRSFVVAGAAVARAFVTVVGFLVGVTRVVALGVVFETVEFLAGANRVVVACPDDTENRATKITN